MDNEEENESELYSERKKFKSKKLVKMSAKKKKKRLFNELSFVEPHVDTFYIGLNDSPLRGVLNPIQAKAINFEEGAAEWVNYNVIINRKKRRKFKNIGLYKGTSRLATGQD